MVIGPVGFVDEQRLLLVFGGHGKKPYYGFEPVGSPEPYPADAPFGGVDETAITGFAFDMFVDMGWSSGEELY